MPCYNQADYIRVALDSALNRGHKEIVSILRRWPLQVDQARTKTVDLRIRALLTRSIGHVCHHHNTLPNSIFRQLVKEIIIEPKTTDPLPEDAIAIQKLTRGYLARKNLRQMQKNEAATKIQALRRGHLARRQLATSVL